MQISSAAQLLSTYDEKLSFGKAELDQFFGGGLPVGAMSEWGMPLGLGGRSVILKWIAHQQLLNSESAPNCLWIHSAEKNLTIFPPAFKAHGLDLAKIRFVFTDEPIEDLKPLLLDDYFPIIVFDAPKKLDVGSLAFLSRSARMHRQTILILQNYLLTPEQGNIWAKTRVNCRQDSFEQPDRYVLQGIRGITREPITAHLLGHQSGLRRSV